MPKHASRRSLFVCIRKFFGLENWMLRLSEKLEAGEWDNKLLGNLIALMSHSLSVIAQANLRSTDNIGNGEYDVEKTGPSWLNYIATRTIYFLATFSILNALYTFTRKRPYRMFESCMDKLPNTSSASRVNINASLTSISPLRSLAKLLKGPSVKFQAQTSEIGNVWEISVWDPLPVCLRLFCLFSPWHISVYWLFLPIKNWDTQPSLTVLKTVVLQIVMTIQLLLIQKNFSQQGKDASVINREVMSEYEIKFVQPRLKPPVRDVGTQYCTLEKGNREEKSECLVTEKPNFITKRGFQIKPSINYANYLDVDGRYLSTRDQNSPSLKQIASMPVSPKSHTNLILTPKKSQSRRIIVGRTTSTNSSDGGSLGIFSHANSPLRKSAGFFKLQARESETPRNSLEMAHREIREQRGRSRSPKKRPS